MLAVIWHGWRERLTSASAWSDVVRRERAGRTFYFCSEHCAHAFDGDPDRYLGPRAAPVESRVAQHHGGHARAHEG